MKIYFVSYSFIQYEYKCITPYSFPCYKPKRSTYCKLRYTFKYFSVIAVYAAKLTVLF